MPWAYIRARLASTWHIPPWEVDRAPFDEIVTQLDLWSIEADARKRKGRRTGDGG